MVGQSLSPKNVGTGRQNLSVPVNQSPQTPADAYIIKRGRAVFGYGFLRMRHESCDGGL